MMHMNGFDKNGLIVDENYQTEVLSRNKSPLHASLDWLKENGLIDAIDLEKFDAIRKHRNELAHGTLSFLTDPEKNVDSEIFGSLIELVTKIEKAWFFYFELAINPEDYPDDLKPEDVTPGSIVSLQLLMEIATGLEPEPGFYLMHFLANKA